MLSKRRALIALTAALALPAAPAAGQDATDTTPPELVLHQPDAASFTYYQQPAQVFFSGDVNERARIEITIHEPDGDVAGYHDLGLQDSGGWYFNTASGDEPPLVHGVEYDATVRATDQGGNTDEAQTQFLADGVAPEYTITEAATETTDSTPRIAGTATMQAGDLPFLTATATRPSADGNGEIGVASVKLEIADGRFSGDLDPELPPGDYTLRLTRLDQAMNATLRFRDLRILPEPEPVAPADNAPPAAPPPPIVDSRILPPPPSGIAATEELARAARRALARVRIARLLRRGASFRFAANQPGVASIRLLRGRRVVAKGRRGFAAAGAATIKVRATRTGRRALRRARAARLTVQATFAPASGPATTAELRLALRR